MEGEEKNHEQPALETGITFREVFQGQDFNPRHPILNEEVIGTLATVPPTILIYIASLAILRSIYFSPLFDNNY